jgi:hypothetical protein
VIILSWFLGRLSCEDKRRIELAYDHGFVATMFTFGLWNGRWKMDVTSAISGCRPIP